MVKKSKYLCVHRNPESGQGRVRDFTDARGHSDDVQGTSVRHERHPRQDRRKGEDRVISV